MPRTSMLIAMYLTTAFYQAIGATNENLDPKEFFRNIAGEYEILLAGGKQPKQDNNVATISLEDTQAFVIMPYCKSDTDPCDLGYLFFTYSTTEVNKVDAENSHYLVLTHDGATTNRFSWEQSPTAITFTNYQYLGPNEPTPTVLQHVLRAKSTNPSR